MTNITTDQQVSLTVIPISAIGNLVPDSYITGIPLWNSSNVNVASLVVAASGFSATAFGTGAGTSSISVIANAGTTANPVQVSGSVQIGVSQAPVDSLEISSSLPILQ
jgi:hypothetical protein